MSLRIRNPHSVLAALESRPRDVLEILLPAGLMDRNDRGGAGADPSQGRDAWLKVMQLARKHQIPVNSASGGGGQGQGAKPGHRAAPHSREEQGRMGVAEAVLKEREPISVEELFRGAPERVGGKGLWLALDSLTDPHNVGAIFRTASFFGVQGILMTQDRSASLTAAVYDVAAGGVEYVPFAVQANLQRAFEVAKDAGLWILGTSEHAQQKLSQVECDRPWLLVLGNEEKGMRRLTEESCDVVCQIPPMGGVTSLNVSVAAGVLISRLTPAG